MKLKIIPTKDLIECVKCGRHFKYRDMKECDRMLYNFHTTIKLCPHCGSYQVEPVREQYNVRKYLFLFSDR